MLALFKNQPGIVDMFNMFSGGALSRFSIFALNVIPYISASIIVQLLGQVYEPWKALKKEGKFGLVGFGTFTVRKRAARKGRNPSTGAEIKIKASKSVGFKQGAELKKTIA